VAGLRAEYEQLQKRETELRGAIDREKGQAASQSRRAASWTRSRGAGVGQGLYDVLLQKLNETDIAASIRNNNVTVVERATAPTTPFVPTKKIASIGAFLACCSAWAGPGPRLPRQHHQGSDEIERFLHLDLIAAVPEYDEGERPFVTEAYQNLRTALIFGRQGGGGQVVLVTGTVPQEGKTTTLVNIGKLLASSARRRSRSDFDLRRGQLHHRLD